MMSARVDFVFLREPAALNCQTIDFHIAPPMLSVSQATAAPIDVSISIQSPVLRIQIVHMILPTAMEPTATI